MVLNTLLINPFRFIRSFWNPQKSTGEQLRHFFRSLSAGWCPALIKKSFHQWFRRNAALMQACRTGYPQSWVCCTQRKTGMNGAIEPVRGFISSWRKIFPATGKALQSGMQETVPWTAIMKRRLSWNRQLLLLLIRNLPACLPQTHLLPKQRFMNLFSKDLRDTLIPISRTTVHVKITTSLS